MGLYTLIKKLIAASDNWIVNNYTSLDTLRFFFYLFCVGYLAWLAFREIMKAYYGKKKDKEDKTLNTKIMMRKK